jgi:hypothetical protein
MKRRKSRTGLPKPKGGGRASKRKVPSKIKTKVKTATRGTKKSQQRVAINKATAPAESATLSYKGKDEAAPSSITDVIEATTTNKTRESIEGIP